MTRAEFALMLWYALASLIPASALIVACLFGGLWCYVALFAVTGLVIGLDRFTWVSLPDRDRAATSLCLVLGCVHFFLLALGVWTLAATGAQAKAHNIAQAVSLFLALGLFLGQVSNANAHELIHHTTRWPRLLGKAVFTSLLFGHHASAHPKVHHVWVATPRDPNSARRGESFYRFWGRAWVGSFRAGMQAETRQRRHQSGLLAPLHHPYVAYGLGAIATLAGAAALAGWRGVVILILVALYAQMQLLLSDYVQHYGLRRSVRPDGTPEPVAPHHSWNARPWFSSAMMLNAPRHSDHHMHPGRSFPMLRLCAEDMPMLPLSFPVMGAVAFVPMLWRRLMDPRVENWTAREEPGGNGGLDLPELSNAPTGSDSSLPDRAARTGPDAIERRGL